jgi:hypothetical protein
MDAGCLGEYVKAMLRKLIGIYSELLVRKLDHAKGRAM